MRSCPSCHSPYAGEVNFCGIDGARLEPSDPAALVGTEIGRLRISAHIADGTIGRVYHATHTFISKQYAVKVLLGEIASERALAERIRREARAVGTLAHPNIVSIVDVGSTPEGLLYLTLELVTGRDLRSIIREEGPLPPERAAEIARKIAAALSAAHAESFVHGDLKPSNVMVTDEPGPAAVKVLDFGLVRALEVEGEARGSSGRPRSFRGQPFYSAPEQITGFGHTAHTDLYALGVMLFEMLEGELPFRGKSLPEVRKKQLLEPPTPLRPSKGLEGLVFRLLAKSPAERPRSALEVIKAIDQLFGPALEPQGLTDRVPSPAPQPRVDLTSRVVSGPTAVSADRQAREITQQLERPNSRGRRSGASYRVPALERNRDLDAEGDSTGDVEMAGEREPTRLDGRLPENRGAAGAEASKAPARVTSSGKMTKTDRREQVERADFEARAPAPKDDEDGTPGAFLARVTPLRIPASELAAQGAQTDPPVVVISSEPEALLGPPTASLVDETQDVAISPVLGLEGAETDASGFVLQGSRLLMLAAVAMGILGLSIFGGLAWSRHNRPGASESTSSSAKSLEGEGVAPVVPRVEAKLPPPERAAEGAALHAEATDVPRPAGAEPAKSEVARPESAKPEAVKPEVAKVASPNPEPSKPIAPKAKEPTVAPRAEARAEKPVAPRPKRAGAKEQAPARAGEPAPAVELQFGAD